jgi:hypothetical protein
MATPAATLLNIKASPSSGQNFFNLAYAHDTGSLINSTQAQVAALDDAPYFTTSDNGIAVKMRISTDAATTSGSTHARCELRELQSDGSTLAAWNPLDGNEHILSGRSRINHIPSYKSSTTVAQVHNAASDVMELETRGGTFYGRSANDWYVILTLNGTASGRPILLDHCQDGIEFGWKIRIYGGGHFGIYINDMVTPVATDATTGMAHLSTFLSSTADCYFKSGNYVQATTAENNGISDYAEIELRDLHCWHTGQTASQILAFGTDATPGVGAIRWGVQATAVAVASPFASVTPAFPTSTDAPLPGDLVLVVVRVMRTAGHSGTATTPGTPSGWTRSVNLNTVTAGTGGLTAHAIRYQVFTAEYAAGMSAPTFTTGSANDGIHAIAGSITSARLAIATTSALGVATSSTTTTLGPAPAISTVPAGAVVIVLLDHEYAKTSGSLSTITGDGLTWTEAEENITTWCHVTDYAVVATDLSTVTQKTLATSGIATTGEGSGVQFAIYGRNRRNSLAIAA